MPKPTQGQSPQSGSPGRGFDWRILIAVFAIILGVGLFWAGSAPESVTQELSYSQFMQQLKAGHIKKITMQGQSIRGLFTEAYVTGEQQPSQQRFTTTRPPIRDPELMKLLEQHNVTVTAKSSEMSWWQSLLIGLLPWILILGIIIYFSIRMQKRMSGQGGPFSFGRSKARRHREASTGVVLDNVAGADQAKRETQEIIEYLKEPERYRDLGAKIPKGVLLMGPPGVGKTMLAKAVAGEASVPFYSISGSEFIEMFVGVGASRVRDMFRDAKGEAPSIIFIDELDSIGRARGTGLGGGHDEREQTLNQILAEMDGFGMGETVVVMAATNRPDVLDPALLRPGRFDRKIVMERPVRKARRAILGVHAQGKPLADDVDLDLIASRTIGFSGADLQNLTNEAALLAGRRERKQIDMECFNLARDKIVFGEKREEVLHEQDKEVIANHEAGHTLMAWLLPKADKPDKVTIIPRGQALGATEQTPIEERVNMSESYLRDRIGVMLGGRAAERLVFNETSTGAQNDLRQATTLVRRMVAEWGMSSEIGAASFPRGESQPFLGRELTQGQNFSEHTAERIDQEISRLLEEMDQHTRRLLEENQGRLRALAKLLLEQETVEGEELQRLFETTTPATGRIASPG